MSALATALSQAMTTSTNNLVVLDRASGQWTPHPWQEAHARAENIADRILDGPAGAVGLVGEPNVEFVAAIQGAWLAGRSLSVLPGPSVAPMPNSGPAPLPRDSTASGSPRCSVSIRTWTPCAPTGPA